MTRPHNNPQGTAGSEQHATFTYTLRLKMDGQFPGAPDYDEWVISEDAYDFVKASYNALKLKKISDSDPLFHTSAPTPAKCGCDGCRKEIEHLDCSTPGQCDQMKCPLCCEGSDFPTLPEEIKKYEAAAAKAAREQILTALERDFKGRYVDAAVTEIRRFPESLRQPELHQ